MKLHLIYENTAAKTLDLYYTDSTAFMIELENLENQNLRLINKIHQIEKIYKQSLFLLNFQLLV